MKKDLERRIESLEMQTGINDEIIMPCIEIDENGRKWHVEYKDGKPIRLKDLTDDADYQKRIVGPIIVIDTRKRTKEFVNV